MPKPTHALSCTAVLVTLAGALAAGGAQADAARPADKPVGEITLSVGPVVKTSAQGVPERVTRGSRILPGDRLDTAEGGQVHIRFIDGAMVSVRPGSRLVVEDYQFDPKQVAQSLVRFKLEYGVARAISGAAAEGARDRFRLNTPLVAIGVRGTDFVVRTGANNTSAAVNQGAIVMAPLGEGCAAQSLGPCVSAAAQLLSADMGRMLVEFRPALPHPELRPLLASAFAAHSEANGQPPLAGPGGPGPAPGGGPVLAAAPPQDIASAVMVEGAVQNALEGGVPAVEPPAPPPPAPPPPVEPPPPPPPPPPPAPPPVLQWGRWADVGAPGDDLSQPRVQAAVGRSVTVGNFGWALYRASSGETQLPKNLGGTFNFSLDRSFAHYSLNGQSSPASVQNGVLSIDFVNRNFSTQLQVVNALTGQVTLGGSGFVRSDGVFVDRTQPGLAIAGSTSFDGRNAGYFFEKAIGAGTLSGITLWSRP